MEKETTYIKHIQAVGAFCSVLTALSHKDEGLKDEWCIRMTDNSGLQIMPVREAVRFLAFGTQDEATNFLEDHKEELDKLSDIGLL